MAAGFEVIARELHDAGVRTVFGVMGEGNMSLIAHWAGQPEHRYVAARHEAGAAAMAAGYAHVTGGLSVCTVTHGPGATNAITALTTAARAGRTVLAVTGDIPAPARPGHTQRIDHAAVAALCGADYVELTDPATARPRLAELLARAARGHRTTLLNVPVDVQHADWLDAAQPAQPAPAEPGEPDSAAVQTAADALASAAHPLVVVGRGALRAGAADVLRRLAHHLGCPLLTTLQAKDLYRGDPLAAGIAGGFATSLGRELIKQADCVAAFGASLNSWTTAGGHLFDHARVVQADIDPAAIGRLSKADLPLTGDALATAGALLAAVEALVPEQRERRERVAAAVAAWDRSGAHRAEPSVRGQRAMWALDRVLPRERTVVVDGGHFMGYAAMELPVPGPDAFVWSSDFGSIGLGLGMGIGAALGRADRTTVVVTGDGGLAMNLGELETAARHCVPLVVVVMNDGAYGAEAHIMRHRGLAPSAAVMPPPDFTEVALALGMPAVAIDDLDRDLDRVAHLLRAPDGPILLEIKVDHREIAPYFRRVLDSH